jgi:hypothetical protein
MLIETDETGKIVRMRLGVCPKCAGDEMCLVGLFPSSNSEGAVSVITQCSLCEGTFVCDVSAEYVES